MHRRPGSATAKWPVAFIRDVEADNSKDIYFGGGRPRGTEEAPNAARVLASSNPSIEKNGEEFKRLSSLKIPLDYILSNLDMSVIR